MPKQDKPEEAKPGKDRPEEEQLLPSKSEIKRQMTALQKVGTELVNLSPRELAKKSGPGDYVAKFFAGPSPAMTYEFEIESPDE